MILPLITIIFKITEAKFQTIIRVKKFYAANYKKVPCRHLQGTLWVEILLNFVTKSNKILEIADCFLLNCRQDTVGYSANTKAEVFFIEPFFSENHLNDSVIAESICCR